MDIIYAMEHFHLKILNQVKSVVEIVPTTTHFNLQLERSKDRLINSDQEGIHKAW
jgi:hypothetical protein